jgi:hypothetical protein
MALGKIVQNTLKPMNNVGYGEYSINLEVWFKSRLFAKIPTKPTKIL